MVFAIGSAKPTTELPKFIHPEAFPLAAIVAVASVKSALRFSTLTLDEADKAGSLVLMAERVVSVALAPTRVVSPSVLLLTA